MEQRTSGCTVAMVLGLALLFMAGCAGRSKPASFYVLSPMAGMESASGKTPGGMSDFAIAIAPVSLPKYLKKHQIVTRTGSNELHLAEFDRWAGKLEEDIGRVIAEDLCLILGTDRIFSSPAMTAVIPDYTIAIDIIRFDGTLGGDVELSARWSILTPSDDILSDIKAVHIIESINGSEYVDMVAAQSRVLAAFSRVLAAAIKELPES